MQGIRNTLNPTPERQSAKSKLRTPQDKPTKFFYKKRKLITRKKKEIERRINRLKEMYWNFPGGPVGKTPCSQCRGPKV